MELKRHSEATLQSGHRHSCPHTTEVPWLSLPAGFPRAIPCTTGAFQPGEGRSRLNQGRGLGRLLWRKCALQWLQSGTTRTSRQRAIQYPLSLSQNPSRWFSLGTYRQVAPDPAQREWRDTSALEGSSMRAQERGDQPILLQLSVSMPSPPKLWFQQVLSEHSSFLCPWSWLLIPKIWPQSEVPNLLTHTQAQG